MQVLLHCGYSPMTKLAYRAGTVHGYRCYDRSTDERTYTRREVEAIRDDPDKADFIAQLQRKL